MRILQVCLKPPFPKVDGGCVAMAAMTESMLMAGLSVKMLCMSTHKHPFKAEKIPTELRTGTDMEAVEMDTRLKPLGALLNLFSSASYNVVRFHSAEFEARLTSILKDSEFDIIHLESIFCTPYLETVRKHSKAKVVVRCHNVEFEIWQQLAQQERQPLKKWYLRLLEKRLRNYELKVLQQVDGILTITNEDRTRLKELGIGTTMETIPVGIHVEGVPNLALRSDRLKLYHLGAMDWTPNVEGIWWFVNEIWPMVQQAVPEATCSLAGRNMPPELLAKEAGNLKVKGEVISFNEFIADRNIAIVPLLSGSGMRVKIVEALAHGKVVITTSIGATGIPYTDGQNLLIANAPQEFTERIRQLDKDRQLVTSIGKEARKLAEGAFDLKKLSSKLAYFYANL